VGRLLLCGRRRQFLQKFRALLEEQCIYGGAPSVGSEAARKSLEWLQADNVC
jgi:hypothetical protein